ncbi:cytochrome P450 [Streptomyces spongiae]|uniref:Cytochrome P450 n=1 Tax=Streptomyces spongiae TaxID=565072 RepID=A0A5N8XJW5_9ACTN|nr:cytochrome P450 [Streptomyces spongiae]MPY59752.1 cytochrome P450 [Streptomyces spongiae]
MASAPFSSQPTYSSRRAPHSLPVLGHALPLLRDPLGFLRSLPTHGDLVRIRVGPFRGVVVCDSELTRQLLLNDQTFDKGGPMFERLREFLGDGLGTCSHSQHRRRRRLIQPAFQPARLSGYAEMMAAQIDAATRSWREGQRLDVLAEMLGLTARITVEAMFSRALSTQELTNSVADLIAVSKGISRRAITPPLADRLPTPGNRRYRHADTRLRQTVDRIIDERRSGNVDRNDLLSTLLDAHASDAAAHGGLTNAEIREQVISFFFAGAETTANLLAWTLHLIALHPDIEARIHAEVDAVLGDTPAGLDHLANLQFTSRVVTETLRLYPPGWIFTRTVTRSTELAGCSLTPGTTVIYSPYLIHRRSDLFDNPERFDPDRWDASHRTQPPREAFIPFGAGARKCIGDQFGITEAILALATIVARWRLQPLPGQGVRPVPNVVLSPHGLFMRTTARTERT